MKLLERESYTIASVITPPGHGGVAVIRVSGSASLGATRAIAPFLPENPESHKVYYGYLQKQQSLERMDEVLVTFFARGRSFTGEDSIEISHHGNPTISKLILAELLKAGVKMAQPGEFTFRAFMNQRIDLMQAEAVLDLIQAKSERTARIALQQLEGRFSKVLHEAEHELTGVLAHLEANLDFAQEDIVVEERSSLEQRLQRVRDQFTHLLSQVKNSERLRSGFRVALVGAPNVGKSSLLNALCEQDIAIVSDVPGTTRDFVFADLTVDGQPVHLFDTAGLRETEDVIEKLGIERTTRKIEEADLVIQILDATASKDRRIQDLQHKDMIIAFNKMDCLTSAEAEDLGISFPNALFVSAKKKRNLESIVQQIKTRLSELSNEESPALFQARHAENFQTVVTALSESIRLIEENASDEFIIAEVQEALMALFETLGKRFDDEILDRVFKEFCLGK